MRNVSIKTKHVVSCVEEKKYKKCTQEDYKKYGITYACCSPSALWYSRSDDGDRYKEIKHAQKNAIGGINTCAHEYP